MFFKKDKVARRESLFKVAIATATPADS